MMESSIRLPDIIDIVLALALSLHFLSVCAAVSIPWLAAHLEFWGKDEESRSYWTAASQLSEIAVYNLGALFLSGVLSYFLASLRTPETLLAASVLLAPGLGVFFGDSCRLCRSALSLPAGMEEPTEDCAYSYFERRGRRSHGGVLRGFSRGAYSRRRR